MKTRLFAALAGIGLFASTFVGTAQALTLVSQHTYSVPSAAYCPAVDQTYFTQVYNGDLTCTRSYYR